jgi:3-methylcrotonyl-CoA carboxylase beta subunit
MLIANDSTVKGGSYFQITVRKHLRAQEIAEQHYLPCIYLDDSGGPTCRSRMRFSQMQINLTGFFQSSPHERQRHPTNRCHYGFVHRRWCLRPCHERETIIVKGTGTIFLGGPPLVKAATGENVSAGDLGGADVHTRLSSVADHFAEDDEHYAVAPQ